jgi:transposase
LSDYGKEDLIYIDEAGMDSNEGYPYGWSAKGERVWSKKSGKRESRLNFIGALSNKQFLSPFIFNGYCDAKVFEAYLEKCLLPELSSKKIIIADNAAFHKSIKARELIEAKNCQLLFLPAYSPDLNPIEHEWFPIKNKIRQLLDEGHTLESSADTVLRDRSKAIC